MNSCSVIIGGLRSNRGKKLVSADDELLGVALQYDRRFTRCQRGAALYCVEPAFITYLNARTKTFKTQMIRLGIDLFHDRFL